LKIAWGKFPFESLQSKCLTGCCIN
jgi:hypothetical protein